MKLNNEFVVSAPIDDAWPVLLDIPRIAGCLPGAIIEGGDGQTYRGRMSAKVGPIIASYRGSVHIQEIDDDDHVVVLAMEARETKGQGLAGALIRNHLTGEGDNTRVTVQTDLKMSGAHAQFGRGILESVAGSMTQQFARNLEQEIARGQPPLPTEGVTPPKGSRATDTDMGTGLPQGDVPVEPLNVTGLLRGSISSRRVADIAAITAVVALGWLFRRRRSVPTLTISIRYHRSR